MFSSRNAHGTLICYTCCQTIVGKNTFHATQYAAWQRSPKSVGILQNITPPKSATLKVLGEMNAILPAYIREGTAETQFKEDMKEEWFKKPIQNCPSGLKVEEATDTAFFLNDKRRTKVWLDKLQ